MKNKRTIIKITAYLTILLLVAGGSSPFRGLGGVGGNTKIDSLKTVIETTDHDTTRIKALNQLGWSLMYSNPDTAIILSKQALELTKKTKDEKSKANTLSNLGVYHWIKSDYPTALDYLHKSLEYREKAGDRKGMAASYNNIGIIYDDQSSYPQALEYYFKSLKIKKQLGDKKGIATSYNNIGSLYTALYEQGDSLNERIGGWVSRNPSQLLDTAMYYQQKALAINKELSRDYGMTFDLIGIGSIYAQKQEYTKAIQYYQQASQLADSIGALKEGSDAHSGLAACYEQLGNSSPKSPQRGDFPTPFPFFKLALEHYKQYTTLKDTVFNEEKSKEIGKLEARHEMEMAEMKRKQEEEEQARILEQQTQRRHLLQYSGIFIFIIGIFAVLLFSGRLNIPVKLAKSGVFFTFLLVFEFVLVLIDPYIEQWTGGEPAYNLAVNVALAGLFLPLHNIAVRKLEQRLFKTRKKKLEKNATKTLKFG